MNEIVKIVCLGLLSACIDAVWLFLQSTRFSEIVQDIQTDRPMKMRIWGGIPVYIAIGYLVTQMPSAPRAFLAGLTSYAIYDFTQIATLDRYPLSFALADSSWGGVLFALTWWVGNKMGILRVN